MQNEAEAEDEMQWKDYGNSPNQLGALEQGWPSRIVSDLGAGAHSLCPCINQTLGVSCPLERCASFQLRAILIAVSHQHSQDLGK